MHGWQSYGVSRYRHFSGARVIRRGNKWIAGFVDKSNHLGHRTAKAAVAFIEANDPAFWTFDRSTSFGCVAGLWLETAYIDGIRRNQAFIGFVKSGEKPTKSVEGILRKYVFGIASCAKCSRPMSEFVFIPKPYFGSWIPQQRSGKGWSFIACECGHPVWRGDIIETEEKLSRLEKGWKRKERIRDAEGHYTSADIKELHELQDGRCLYCDVLFTSEKGYTIDHIKSLVSGGSHWPENLCLACHSCNSKKHDLDLADFALLLGSSKKNKIVQKLTTRIQYLTQNAEPICHSIME